jgi:hypothetical protein
MKFIMMVIPEEGYSVMTPGTMPDPEAIKKMAQYNDELHKAGVLVSLYGLKVPSEGSRITFPSGKPRVQDGPFAEAKEMVGGFWIVDVPSREAAIEWACKVPPVENFTIEVRQIEGPDDFVGLQPENSTYNEYARKDTPQA